MLSVSSFAGAVRTIPFGWPADRVHRVRLLTIAVLVWVAAMLATAAATSYLYLLVARISLGVIAAAAPAVASLTGGYFLPRLRGRMYGYIGAGEFLGTGFGFIAAGELALLSWRAGFIILTVAVALVAWVLHRLPEPARGGDERLQPGQKQFGLPGSGPDRLPESVNDRRDRRDRARAKVLAAGIEPRAHLVFDENPGHKPLAWAVWYILRIPTNLVLITASALGYYV